MKFAFSPKKIVFSFFTLKIGEKKILGEKYFPPKNFNFPLKKCNFFPP